jgi:signal transduction histidine kinase
LTSSGDLTSLPAAVEVAAYRIVSEALTNVARHACARRADIALRRSSSGPEVLEVVVADDGAGIDVSAPAGVGLVSLRERAAELGGSVSVVCPPAGGTVVTARLPVSPRIPVQATGSVSEGVRT